MLYIHQTYCISPQKNPLEDSLDLITEPVDKKLLAIEPVYDKIPPGILRRMGKAIRMGVGTALPLVASTKNIEGIIIGSANAGMDECVKFLNQIVDYDEGQLTPGNFVQSTGNVIAGQLGMISRNKGYNVTHVHLGLAFENALIDAVMQLNANPTHSYLLGGVDEISPFHYNIEMLTGAYKTEDLSNRQLYKVDSPGCIAGEGAAVFVVNADKQSAVAQIKAIITWHSDDMELAKQQIINFLEKNRVAVEEIDLLISGENGDNRTLPFYAEAESLLRNDTAIIRFKHLCGEYATAAAVGVWYACETLKTQHIPTQMFKKDTHKKAYKHILMYNNFKGYQHSITLVSACT